MSDMHDDTHDDEAGHYTKLQREAGKAVTENMRLQQLDVLRHAELKTIEEIERLRARVAELEKTLAEANEEADVRDGEGDTLVGQIKMYVQHRHYLASQNITLRKRVAELEAENANLREPVTWRPIGDLEPSIGEYVLLSIHMMGKRTPELGYRDPLGIVRSNYRAVCDYATHWMPLPEAPR